MDWEILKAKRACGQLLVSQFYGEKPKYQQKKKFWVQIIAFLVKSLEI
jgi:hypothetical protein